MNIVTLKRLANEAESVEIYPDPRFPPSLYYRFLRLLTKEMKPKGCVELGTCGGGAALHMCLGSPDSMVISIDKTNDYPDNVQHIKSQFDCFHFWLMDSVDAAEFYYNAVCGGPGELSQEIGVLFIDTYHTYEQVGRELHAWLPFLIDGAVVCLDDLYRERMIDFWNELPYEKVRLDFLHPSQSPTDGGFGAFIVR
jgi:predicted O-methyltransferase YrrM